MPVRPGDPRHRLPRGSSSGTGQGKAGRGGPTARFVLVLLAEALKSLSRCLPPLTAPAFSEPVVSETAPFPTLPWVDFVFPVLPAQNFTT